MLANAAAMLASAQRYQGAYLAGDAQNQAAQETAFNAALDQYEPQKATFASALSAFVAELPGQVADVDLSQDASLQDAQAYYAGLANPQTDDPS